MIFYYIGWSVTYLELKVDYNPRRSNVGVYWRLIDKTLPGRSIHSRLSMHIHIQLAVLPQSTTDRPIVVSPQTGRWFWVNRYIIHIFMQCALKITCVFSVIIHHNIDPKLTENPTIWRTARIHDFGISIFCGFCADTTVWWARVDRSICEWMNWSVY